MKVKYYVFNPTQNITLLVETSVPVDVQPRVAARLMELEPLAEQVGFVEGTSLRMAGGEFCGNATMSAAVLNCIKNGITENTLIKMRVSGVESELNVKVAPQPDGSFTGTADMPLPVSVEEKVLEFEGRSFRFPLIAFGGIVHLVDETGSLNPAEAEKAAKKWCCDLGADALGIMFIDGSKTSLTPLVYAKNAGTLFWERSCASGTAAVGNYLAKKEQKPVDLTFSEPGGTLQVFSDGKKTELTGTVRLVKECEIEL